MSLAIKKTLAIILSLFVLTSGNAQSKESSPCKSLFHINDVTLKEANTAGFYSMFFDIDIDVRAGEAKNIDMLVTLKNCKGETMTIKMTAKQDAKGHFIASQSLAQNKECPWEFSSASIQILDNCGEVSSWNIRRMDFKSIGHKTHPIGLRLGISKGWE
jgi:hypothetical protein